MASVWSWKRCLKLNQCSHDVTEQSGGNTDDLGKAIMNLPDRTLLKRSKLLAVSVTTAQRIKKKKKKTPPAPASPKASSSSGIAQSATAKITELLRGEASATHITDLVPEKPDTVDMKTFFAPSQHGQVDDTIFDSIHH